MPDSSLLPILNLPAPELRAKARLVGEADMDAVRALAPRMLATMYKAPGIGLAAPQIGTLLRLVVIDLQPDDQPDPLVMVNPEILAASDDLAIREEGCLSLPNIYAEVSRPAEIKVRWKTLEGRQQEMTAGGLLATCIQHEIDHLNGVLFVDHLSALKRNMLLRRLAKELKTKFRDQA